MGVRRFSVAPKYFGALRGWGTVANIAAGAYIGGLVVCLGSLYFMYSDADSRQHIPFEISFSDQITAVKAINKDDVLRSPRYAVKHYRRLLIDLLQQEQPDLEFSETREDGLRNYAVPLLSAELLQSKSADFAHFYIDMAMRYAKALLAKGLQTEAVEILEKIVDNDVIFYNLGDPERMSQCCRMLSRLGDDPAHLAAYLQRSINMLTSTFRNVSLDQNYVLQDGSRVTDELVLALDALAATYAHQAKTAKGRKRDEALTSALNIYLSNLRCVSHMRDVIELGELTQALFPLFNCSEDNLAIVIAETKAHISEVMWAKGFHKNAVSWGEEVVHDIYFDNGNSARASPILIGVLDNLIVMYTKLKEPASRKRCEELRLTLRVFDSDPLSWYNSLINRWSKIIYSRGPLGILEKALKERFGPPERIPDIEEYEEEDEET